MIFLHFYFERKSVSLQKTHLRSPFLFYFLVSVLRFFFLLGSRYSFFLSLHRMGRFFSLVDTPEQREEFKKKYKIPSDVTIEHCNLGEWHEKMPSRAVAIPMIAFIERGIRILMGKVTKDFLCLFRLYPTQCAPNIFRILGSVDALNDKMGVSLTLYDINWIYSFQNNKEMRYYLKTRGPLHWINFLPS